MPASPATTSGDALHRTVVMGAALAALALGSAFHAGAGGFLPSTAGLLIIGLLVWTITASIYRVGRGPLSLIASVAVGQAIVHFSLTAAAGHAHAGGTHAGPATAPSSAIGPPVDAVIPGSLADALGVNGLPTEAVGVDPVAVALHRLAEEMTMAHTAMGIAHAAAGALVGLWLVMGQRALVTFLGLWAAPVLAASLATRTRLLAAALANAEPRLKVLLRLPQPPALKHQQRSRTEVLRGPPGTGLPARLTPWVTAPRASALV